MAWLMSGCSRVSLRRNVAAAPTPASRASKLAATSRSDSPAFSSRSAKASTSPVIQPFDGQRKGASAMDRVHRQYAYSEPATASRKPACGQALKDLGRRNATACSIRCWESARLSPSLPCASCSTVLAGMNSVSTTTGASPVSRISGLRPDFVRTPVCSADIDFQRGFFVRSTSARRAFTVGSVFLGILGRRVLRPFGAPSLSSARWPHYIPRPTGSIVLGRAGLPPRLRAVHGLPFARMMRAGLLSEMLGSPSLDGRSFSQVARESQSTVRAQLHGKDDIQKAGIPVDSVFN